MTLQQISFGLNVSVAELARAMIEGGLETIKGGNLTQIRERLGAYRGQLDLPLTRRQEAASAAIKLTQRVVGRGRR